MFTMRQHVYRTAIAAQKAGERAGLPADRRMVRKCLACPASVRSKRPAASAAKWGQLAEILGLPVATVRAAAHKVGLPGARS